MKSETSVELVTPSAFQSATQHPGPPTARGAGVLVTLPHWLVTTTSYIPASAEAKASIVKLAFVAPEMSVPSLRQRNSSGPVPVAMTVNATASPVHAATGAGSRITLTG